MGEARGPGGRIPTSCEVPEHRGEQDPRSHHGSGASVEERAPSYLSPSATPPHLSSTERSKPTGVDSPNCPTLQRERTRRRTLA